jgi:phenylacetate-coenzyme A ligase PaaK-like adenylate-forming protein
MKMSEHYDKLEIRPPEIREAAQFAALPDLISRAMNKASGWRRHLSGFDPAEINTRQMLATLPVLRKSDLKGRQEADPPFGGFAIDEDGSIGHIFVSPGPIFEPEGRSHDWWRGARSAFAAGFRKGDVVWNTFAYHLTPGGWLTDAAFRDLGCKVVPAGPGQTEQQLEGIARVRPNGYCGVPDYLKILMDKADKAGRPITSIRKALVGGGALFPSLRQEYADRGVTVLQNYGTADIGLIAYESPTQDGSVEGMIVDEGVILEIVRPGTDDVVEPGEVGEIVVTSFNREYPMIRFGTGDMTALLPGQSPCGRTGLRIKGWLGRADQTTKVKGMFVHPEQIASVAKAHQELGRLRLVVTRADNEQDVMTLHAEVAVEDDQLATAVAETLAAQTKLKGEVRLVPPGSLPNDGKVIADERSYEPS